MKTKAKLVALVFGLSLAGMTCAANELDSSKTLAPGVNPIFRDAFTSDPAPLVVGDTLYVYTGSDIRDENDQWVMPSWRLYSTKDMINWNSHGVILKPTDFEWVLTDAWASQAVEKDGKYYYYVTLQRISPRQRCIGVAVSDSPTGPFVDARGEPLITDQMTPSPNPWDDIDPTVLFDEEGTAWMAWGNPNCYMVKLKPNMIEIDGPIMTIPLPNYTEGPWFHKHNGIYYLIYSGFAWQWTGKKTCYATSDKITGPWKYRGILAETMKPSPSMHVGVIDFKGKSSTFPITPTLS